jgi:hypothetical protein
MLALLLLAPFLGALALALSTATGAAGASLSAQELEGRAHRALARIAAELAGAEAGTLMPDPSAPFGSSRLVFQRAGAGGAAPRPTLEIGLELEPGERDDDIDNDGDGLVDEQQLVYTVESQDAVSRRAVWAHGVAGRLEGELRNGADDNGNDLVDERGLCFVRAQGCVTIRLSLAARERGGGVLVRTVETAVRLRN